MTTKAYKIEISYTEKGVKKSEVATFHGFDRASAEAHMRRYAKDEGWTNVKIKHMSLQ